MFPPIVVSGGTITVRTTAYSMAITITPPAQIQPAAIDTYDDHRMAMCFSLASFGPLPVRINDPGCVSKTFPGYFEEFRRLVS